MQRDYWLSYEWEDESRERLFWNPEKLDFDPLEGSDGTYAPCISELERSGICYESDRRDVSLEPETKRSSIAPLVFMFFACLIFWAGLFSMIKYQM